MKTDKLIFLGGISDNLWLDDGKLLSRHYKQGYRVYDPNGIANSITSNGGGLGGSSGLYLMKSCAIRGRYGEDDKTQQTLEVRTDSVANCITSVQKDSMIIENQLT